MEFITYNLEGDKQLFTTIVDGKKVAKINEFIFTGFSNGIHPYHRNRIDWITKILKSKGIVLNLVEVKTVCDMSIDCDDEITQHNIILPKTPDKNIISSDNNVYHLLQDVETGRGWAVVLKNEEILFQDHRDNVLDRLEEGDLIRSFNIKYQLK